MPFVPTAARYHPLYGLQLRDGDGPWYSTETKLAFLNRGIVVLTGPGDNEEVPLPPDLAEEFGLQSIPGTTHPVAVALAKQKLDPGFPYSISGKWDDIPLPKE